jgi:probable F420-dependent oxidoreductase
MRFGIAFANILDFGTAEGARALGAAAEAAGFDSVWAVEHVVVPAGYESTYPYARDGKMPGGEESPMPDPLIWLAYMAAVTTTLKLATGIAILPQRNPIYTAKEVATLDQLSGGRMVLGVGAGWLAEEFAVLGVPFERRGERLEEYVHALRVLWREPSPTFHGEFVDFTDAICLPQPVAKSVPIVIGGHTARAARRAGELGDGFFPGRGRPQRIAELVGIMREAAERAGRDPDAIEVSASGARDEAGVEELRAAGVTRCIVPPLALDAAGIGEALQRYHDDVIVKVS